jgi:hypothetical protein
MRVKQTFWMIVLSAISVQSISSAVQTKRITNPSIEVRDAQSLTSRTADGNYTAHCIAENGFVYTTKVSIQR